MQFSQSIALSLLPFLGTVGAGWREECSQGGNAQFHLREGGLPYLSTLCPDPTGRQICTMLDLSYCIMNARGTLVPTINGHFERSCGDCYLTGANASILNCKCYEFGQDAPFRITELDLEDVVENRDGLLACWDSKPVTCPGFHLHG